MKNKILKIRPIETQYINSSIAMEFIASILAGLSAVIWGILISSESFLLDAKIYTRAYLNEKILAKQKEINPKATLITLTENTRIHFPDENRIDRTWLANLIKKIQAHHPSVIALDFVFDKPYEEQSDRYFLETISHYDNLVFALPLVETANGFVPQESEFLKKIAHHKILWGIVNTHSEKEDNTWRKTYHIFPYEEKIYLSFSLITYLRSFMKYEELQELLNSSPEIFYQKLLKNPQTQKIASFLLEESIIPYRFILPHLETAIFNEKDFLQLFELPYLIPLSYPQKFFLEKMKEKKILIKKQENYFFHPGIFSPKDWQEKKDITKEEKNILSLLWKENFSYLPFLYQKPVFIGAHYYEKDLHNTSLTAFTQKKDYGVNIHTRIFHLYANSDFIFEFSFLGELFVLLISLGIVFGIMYFYPFQKAAKYFFLFLITYLIINWLCFLLFHIQFGMVFFYLLSLILAALVLFVRYHYTEKYFLALKTNLLANVSEKTLEKILEKNTQDKEEQKNSIVFVIGLEYGNKEFQKERDFYFSHLVKEKGGFYYAERNTNILCLFNYLDNNLQSLEILEIARDLLRLHKTLEQKYQLSLSCHILIDSFSSLPVLTEYSKIEGKEIEEKIILSYLLLHKKITGIWITQNVKEQFIEYIDEDQYNKEFNIFQVK